MSASRRDYPLSTNVSSPVQAMSRRRNKRDLDDQDHDLHANGYARDDFVISDGDVQNTPETDDEDDAFEPIREAGRPVRSRKRQLGPPITIDEKLDRLNETHRMVVEDFVINAKREFAKVGLRLLICVRVFLTFKTMISKNLRDQPFTDSNLREMAIVFPQSTYIPLINWKCQAYLNR